MTGADRDERRDAVVALVRAVAAAWRSGDVAAATSPFTDDARFVTPAGVAVGPAGIGAAMRAYLADHEVLAVDLHRVVVDGDLAVAEWTWTERRRRDGRRATMEDAIVLQVRGGRITAWREYFDPAQTEPVAEASGPSAHP